METAGYALLTQVILGRTGYAGPIVTYLTNQRKGGVGFVSTQVCYRHEKIKKSYQIICDKWSFVFNYYTRLYL